MPKYDIIEEMIKAEGDIINPTLHLKERLKAAAAAAEKESIESCTKERKTGDQSSKFLQSSATK